MNTFWNATIREISERLIGTLDEMQRADLVPDDLRISGLGCPPASDEVIMQDEVRLGRSLPQSYKSFLSASNGLFAPEGYILLYPVSEVYWAEEVAYDDLLEVILDQRGVLEEVSPDFFRNNLKIGEWEGEAEFTLLPTEDSGELEWEAWCFDLHEPLVKRYISFVDLVNAIRDGQILNWGDPFSFVE